ncbi:MAG: hypothetical protein H6727_07055 [Myxococcales bacterium]|nr:hypothetical protein [Myxococcales bacterium]
MILCSGMLVGLSALLLCVSGCAEGPDVMRILARLDDPPEKLSTWRLFRGEMKSHTLNQGVLPYDIATPLFSDYATKYRAVWMPPGKKATSDEKGVFSFPEGTVLIKTFAYPDTSGSKRLVETRLLVHSATGWEAFPYVWNKEQTDATLALVGDTTDVKWSHPSGKEYTFTYVVPNANECKNCHEIQKKLRPLGPKAPQLNHSFTYDDGEANQIKRWIEVGFLEDSAALQKSPVMPNWLDPKTGSVAERARAYLDANCSHCHQRTGPASNSALYLDYATTDPADWGVCKHPVAAGKGAGDLRYGIVPGQPDKSILLFRMLSDESEIRMPELGRVVAHQEGIELIRAWIQEMKGTCPETP